MANISNKGDGNPGKHGGARRLAEKALHVQATGDEAEAERLFAQAQRTDPEAVADVLQERDVVFGRDAHDPRESDQDVAEVTGQDAGARHAPSRAGITGPGSGADSESR